MLAVLAAADWTANPGGHRFLLSVRRIFWGGLFRWSETDCSFTLSLVLEKVLWCLVPKLNDLGAEGAGYVPAAVPKCTDVGRSITILLTRLTVLPVSIVAVEPLVMGLLRYWRGKSLEYWPFLLSMSWMLLAENLDWWTPSGRSCLSSSCACVWAAELPAWTTASLHWSLETPTTNWFLVWGKIVLSRRGTEPRECTRCSALGLSMRRLRVTLSMPSYWRPLSKPWSWLKSRWQLFPSREFWPWSWLKFAFPQVSSRHSFGCLMPTMHW